MMSTRHGGEAPRMRWGDPAAPAPETTPLRDEVEYRLIAHALAAGCRSLASAEGSRSSRVLRWHPLRRPPPRLLARGRSGSVRARRPHTRRDYDGERLAHRVEFAPGSQLAQIFSATELMVNSLHHQAARAVAPGLPRHRRGAGRRYRGLEAADGPLHRRRAVAPRVLWRHRAHAALFPRARRGSALVFAGTGVTGGRVQLCN